MNIKSLLLGSAAAFVAVSGAQAADAIVAAAPEPMEYVKVCDAYGTGYFYIPGTETCLKIGGIVRMDVNFVPAMNGAAGYMYTSTRERLHIYANNDSEFGTVYSFIRLQGIQSNSTSAGSVGAWYYAGIGGLEFGNFDNQWAKFFGYGVDGTDRGGRYTNWSDSNRNYISYSATFGAAKAFVALEDDASGNWAPDVSGGVIGTFGDFTAGLGLGYDESLKSLAVKGLLKAKVDMFTLALQAYYAHTNAADAAAGLGNVYFPTINSNKTYYKQNAFSILGGVSVQATDTIQVNLDGQYWNDKSYFIGGGLTWNVATGFKTMLEGGWGKNYGNAAGTASDVSSLFVRFERSF